MGRAIFMGAILVVLFAHTDAVSSVHPRGDEFLSFCNATTGDEDGDARFARCEKFIRETRRALVSFPVHGIRACIPGDVSDLRLVFAAINWLEDNPDNIHKEADEVLARAFARAWPCPNGS